jgi:hypothetical protein
MLGDILSRARTRWWELAPEAVLGAGLAIFAVTEPDAAFSSFKSVRAVVIMVVVGAAWLAARVLAALVLRPPWARIVVFGVGAFVILNVVVLPSYRDKTVVEAFPVAPVEAAAPTTAAPGPTAAPPTTTAAQPQRLASGSLRGIDHRASGTAALYRSGSGFVVGLEDIDIQPGPDYDLYVVPGADRQQRRDAVRLDDLRGNRGTQFYEVPAGVALEEGAWTVLVWCQTFGVPIANATLG